MWINPVFDRKDERTKTNKDDMIRICSNLNVLTASSTFKENWTDADIVDFSEWSQIVNTVNLAGVAITTYCKKHYKMIPKEATYFTDFENLNLIEWIINEAKDHADILPIKAGNPTVINPIEKGGKGRIIGVDNNWKWRFPEEEEWHDIDDDYVDLDAGDYELMDGDGDIYDVSIEDGGEKVPLQIKAYINGEEYHEPPSSFNMFAFSLIYEDTKDYVKHSGGGWVSFYWDSSYDLPAGANLVPARATLGGPPGWKEAKIKKYIPAKQEYVDAPDLVRGTTDEFAEVFGRNPTESPNICITVPDNGGILECYWIDGSKDSTVCKIIKAGSNPEKSTLLTVNQTAECYMQGDNLQEDGLKIYRWYRERKGHPGEIELDADNNPIVIAMTHPHWNEETGQYEPETETVEKKKKGEKDPVSIDNVYKKVDNTYALTTADIGRKLLCIVTDIYSDRKNGNVIPPYTIDEYGDEIITNVVPDEAGCIRSDWSQTIIK